MHPSPRRMQKKKIIKLFLFKNGFWFWLNGENKELEKGRKFQRRTEGTEGRAKKERKKKKTQIQYTIVFTCACIYTYSAIHHVIFYCLATFSLSKILNEANQKKKKKEMPMELVAYRNLMQQMQWKMYSTTYSPINVFILTECDQTIEFSFLSFFRTLLKV